MATKDEKLDNLASESEAVKPDTNTDTDIQDTGSTEPSAPEFPEDDLADIAAEPLDESESAAASTPKVVTSDANAPKQGKLRRFSHWLCTHKKVSIPAAILLIIAILLAVPYTRYVLAGTVVRQQYTVSVMDSQTGKPVSSAIVTSEGKSGTTNGQGMVTLRLNAGKAKLHIEKKYYKSSDTSVLVPILKQKQANQAKLTATGRQVTINVINKISQKPLKEATVSVFDTKATTDSEGKAVLVVPANKTTGDATVSAAGYNPATFKLTVTLDEKANKVALTPAGQVYFLSNASGKLDVIKTNLDGTNRQVVLAGTGKEDKPSTVLLASRDWKYLALLSTRDDAKQAKLYLIDTTNNDMLTTMDEGTANFTLVGWSDHHFVYQVYRTNVQAWEANSNALKSFDATTKKITTIDQAGGQGTAQLHTGNVISTAYILKNELIYTKTWYSSYDYNIPFPPQADLSSKKNEVHSVQADGSANHVVKDYPAVVNGSTG